MTTTDTPELMRDYDREMLRSSVVTMFYGALQRKKERGYTAQKMADTLGVHKSCVSRWFSGALPNWELNTVSDLAFAMNLDLHFSACDRDSGEVFKSSEFHWAKASSSDDENSFATAGDDIGAENQEWMAS
jgi:hypothetical protein